MPRFLTRNNVRVRLAQAVNTNNDTMILEAATAPFRNPPAPTDPHDRVHLTIVDDNDPITKLEIVNVREMTTLPNGERQIKVDRAQEGTVATAFSSGAIVYLSNTAAAIDAKMSVLERHVAGEKVYFTIIDGKEVRLRSVKS